MYLSLKNSSEKFWGWYSRYYTLNLAVATILFAIQIIHLYWLTTDVVLAEVFGHSFFPTENPLYRLIIAAVDYTEIPALISISFVYIHSLRIKRNFKDVLYLVFINIQWLHLFWITDEVVIEIFRSGVGLEWNRWIAWFAIAIDYLELPVIYETVVRLFSNKRRPR